LKGKSAAKEKISIYVGVGSAWSPLRKKNRVKWGGGNPKLSKRELRRAKKGEKRKDASHTNVTFSNVSAASEKKKRWRRRRTGEGKGPKIGLCLSSGGAGAQQRLARKGFLRRGRGPIQKAVPEQQGRE